MNRRDRISCLCSNVVIKSGIFVYYIIFVIVIKEVEKHEQDGESREKGRTKKEKIETEVASGAWNPTERFGVSWGMQRVTMEAMNALSIGRRRRRPWDENNSAILKSVEPASENSYTHFMGCYEFRGKHASICQLAILIRQIKWRISMDPFLPFVSCFPRYFPIDAIYRAE